MIILPLSDIWGRKKIILVSNFIIVLTLSGLLFAGDSWLMVGWMAVFYGVTFPIYGTCAGDFFPREHMGTVIGAWTPFYGSGAIATHWISGVLRDRTGVYDHAFISVLKPRPLGGVRDIRLCLVQQNPPLKGGVRFF